MLTCIIKSKTSTEFVLHAPSEFDLRIQCDRREAFLDLLKLRFAHMQPAVTLKVYAMVIKQVLIRLLYSRLQA